MQLPSSSTLSLFPDKLYLNENWKYYNMDYHTHGFLELNYIANGSCLYMVGDRKIPLKKKSLLILDSRIPHRKVFDHTIPCAVLGCQFHFLDAKDYPLTLARRDREEAVIPSANSPSSLYANFSDLLFGLPELSQALAGLDSAAVIENASALEPELRTMLGEFRGERNAFSLYTKANALLIDVAKMLLDPAAGKPDYVAMAQNFIEMNYYKIASVDDVAENLHLNVTYLERLFRAETGKTLGQAITGLRMEAAKNLLLNPEVPIADIDAATGYRSRQAFYLQFKKTYGMPPAEYRKHHLGEQPS